MPTRLLGTQKLQVELAGKVKGFVGYLYLAVSLGAIGLWPLGELTGSVADNYEGTAARDGTHVGVTLNNVAGPLGGRAGLYDGVNDYTNIYSTSLNSVFDGLEGTVAGWFKVPSGVWTDGQTRGLIRLYDGTNDEIVIERVGILDNNIRFLYKTGATSKEVYDSSLGGSTAWHHVALTWSDSGDAMKAYVDGVQSGTTQTGLGTWSGALSSTATIIGAFATTPTFEFSGNLWGWCIYDSPLVLADIQKLAQV